ncbi:zinc finger protein Xfin-like [Argiope bruennichi]|uniref:Protein charlatan like protein n=1 Tax=Argiope bruennichi TaxID=94029 RepID=A0A8T0FA90_ARGBR|nr:zinc finger protein Xfin-like [Argiope bruennichi]XP_055942086.1 zinc finger protein Xfin-like [Argiope bruennichi]XP_055942087.1 zinc finger protein Xfin-like [Argiope bruennichi]XP_055942088.1 zinc finger protein Xfin-like [Argiope bruennichi]KAF8787135.1 Protein charlatan like protein [Argiope bruennichi]
MTHSETFLSAKFGGFHSPFTNDYLLKHGNFFMKPTIHPDGFVYPAISESARFQMYKDLKCEVAEPDLPLNFAIKQEKPPTPPASTSPTPLKSPSPTDLTQDTTQMINGHSKNATWILGKQKLSWDNSTVASYNPDTKMFRCVVCNAVGFLSRIAEHYLGTHTSAKVFQCLHCPYSSTWSRCVRMHMAKHHGVPNAPPSLWKGQPLLEEIFQLLTNLKTTVDSQGRERLDPELCDKKFICPKCPYTTDRRDLYLRHENIHKEDKPYHCYICFKLFNRADHVKKHFLRIHRGHPYDISLVRRRPPRVPAVSGNNTSNNGQTKSGSNNFTVDKLISNDNDNKSGNDVIDLSRRDSSPSDSGSNGKQMKTFQCPYCEWEGVDSWCLRRHMNVHLKSFECPICEFKVAKAERLFTHVYRAHKKLICTKCKFLTDLAQDFEVHIKDCCLEMVVSDVFDKISEDSHDDSDIASPELKLESLNGNSDVSQATPFPLPDTTKMFDARIPLDLKGSVSLMPLHNSISYCYPAPQGFRTHDLNGLTAAMPDVVMNGNRKPSPSTQCKVDIKPELASPVQSSSDSGVADIASDNNNDQDYTCYHCGCEFANRSSLETHTELYHRDELKDSDSAKKATPDPPPQKTKKFSCAICNFNSDKQRTIIEHMRFHTGEVLHCQAGPPCAFKTVCDSTLEKHVETEHTDNLKRCPHCGYHCTARVPFIRHYRKCHHSKSCSRCRDIKHSLDPKLIRNEELSQLLETSKSQSSTEEILPYLHRNPYSKKANGITPYAHCNAAMSKVAVAIPPSLQRTADDIVAEISSQDHRERKSRKQSAPRKLLPIDKPETNAVQKVDTICDKNKSIKRPRLSPTLACFRKKLLKYSKQMPPKRCNLNHVRTFQFRNNVSYVRHSYWCLHAMKYHCKKCSRRFRHEYQVLLHQRKEHEKV